MGEENQWQVPAKENKFLTGLMINNSLSGKSKVELVPSRRGRRINIYACGPTVYDAAHLGHARNYVSLDIIRRILRDYFGYEPTLCMNVTDIDDKIIVRSLEEHLGFRELASRWECLFWNDMKALGVELPDIITRVSEHLPDIIQFVENIIANGYAYESKGSVYFDIEAFKIGKSAKGVQHVYNRLNVQLPSDSNLAMEGEGTLGIVTIKKSPFDFALWKKAKPNEPSWDSPWGKGRPGWHIECSCMAIKVLGFPLDIHYGGVDLKFPHHVNELAQTEACFNDVNWVNYFLHCGHLNIKGQKMSKSLKNFISIREFLEKYPARVLRIFFAKHRWDSQISFSMEDLNMVESIETDSTFSNFFMSITAELRGLLDISSKKESGNPMTRQLKLLEKDFQFLAKLNEAQDDIDAALRDNLNTPQVITSLKSIITNTHTYIATEKDLANPLLIKKAGRFCHKMLTVLGLNYVSDSETFELQNSSKSQEEELLLKRNLIDNFCSFRSEIRNSSLEILRKNTAKTNQQKTQEDPDFAEKFAKKILQFCDDIRDKKLPLLGIKIEDRANSAVLWKFCDREELP